MKFLKKSFRLLIVAVLVAAFALTVTACKKDDKDVTTYKVSYVTNMPGVEVPPEYVEEGNAAKRPTNPTCDGYTFVDWYTTSSVDGEPYDFTAPVTQNIKLYGKWTSGSAPVTPPEGDDPVTPQPGTKITVTLNMLYDGKTTPVEIKSGETLPAEYSELTRGGFTFGGWFTDEACTQLYNLKTPVTKTMTLYAKWSKKGTDGDGINFSKYWDGASGGTSGGVDGFTFTKTVNIGSVSVDPATPEVPVTSDGQCIITFNSNGGTAVSPQSLEAGYTAVKPVAPEKDGYMFAGWYTNSGCTTAYDFDSKVNSSFTLYAKWVEIDSRIVNVYGYNESLAVEWNETNAANATVQYAKNGESNWKSVDKMLIRAIDSSTARVDIVGLNAGEYQIKVKPSASAEYTLPACVTVDEYDRSGYAHFKYSDGVGAYNDDGTLKDGALVIYVNNANKNNVVDYVYKNTANGLVKEDISAYIKPGVPTSNGKPLGGNTYGSIGYILNNRGYENNNERAQYGIQALTQKYGAVAVRILDKVTSELNSDNCSPTLTGLTYYAKAGNTNPITGEKYAKGVSVPNGGTVNDNGQMARIVNAKNLTIEGIGEDAMIFGWGVHFVSNDNLHKIDGAGKSFEVRNVTFQSYPEDAIGMEGTQGLKVDPTTGSITGGATDPGADLISPVERCWIHHNTFLPGFCANPAESDKAEGDGSCDFKRGQFYTLSYNYFTDCHKTNLCGSSDQSVTYNLTMHHNWWNNCGARQPLLRRANCHFYNNYISGDMARTPKPDLSYITSARANSYMFSENNYYEGSKQIVVLASGGAVKSYNNSHYACFGGDASIHVENRTDSISNSCKFIYRNIDYSTFDTDSELFYYDSANKVSDCLLDDSTTARARAMMYAGVHGFGTENTAMNLYSPKAAVTNGKIDLSAVGKGNSELNNVMFNGVSVSSGTVKGKGQMITFTLTAETQLLVTTSTTGEPAPQIIDSYGKVWSDKFTDTVTMVLPAGTYIIASGQKDKEATITALEFADTAASSAARVEAAKKALEAIPSDIGINDEDKIKAAQTAYNGLMASEREQIESDLYQRLPKAEAAYNSLLTEYVVARIDYIGKVTEESYNKINAAQAAYNKLSVDQQKEVTNYATLKAAQAEFEGFAVINVINRILDLPDLSKATILTQETLDKVESWYHAVDLAFEALSHDEESGESQQAQVKAHNGGKTYAILTNGLAEMSKFENMINFKAALEEISVDNITVGEGASLKNLHDSLSEEQLGTLSLAEKTKYDEVIAKYTELANKSAASTFIGGKPSNEIFKVNSGNAANTKFTVHAYGGELESGLKMESSTQVEFTISAKMVLKLYLDEAGKIKVGINGAPKNKVDPEYESKDEGGDNVVTVTLEAGTYYITKSSSLRLYYATLTPAD